MLVPQADLTDVHHVALFASATPLIVEREANFLAVGFSVQRPVVGRCWWTTVFVVLIFLLPFAAPLALTFALFWNFIGHLRRIRTFARATRLGFVLGTIVLQPEFVFEFFVSRLAAGPGFLESGGQVVPLTPVEVCFVD